MFCFFIIYVSRSVEQMSLLWYISSNEWGVSTEDLTFTVLCDGVLPLALLTLTPVRAHRVHTGSSPTHSGDSNTLIHIYN